MKLPKLQRLSRAPGVISRMIQLRAGSVRSHLLRGALRVRLPVCQRAMYTGINFLAFQRLRLYTHLRPTKDDFFSGRVIGSAPPFEKSSRLVVATAGTSKPSHEPKLADSLPCLGYCFFGNLCRALCRNPAILTGVGPSRWLSLSYWQSTRNVRKTRLNTLS